MKAVSYLILMGFMLYACTRDKAEESGKSKNMMADTVHAHSTPDKNIAPLATSDNKTPSKDTIPVHVFQRGETLWNLCRTYYGNRHYSSIVAIYNDIVNAIKESTLIRVPSLKSLLCDPKLGLDPVIHNEIEKIIEARARFMRHEKALFELRNNQSKGTVLKLPDNIKEDLETAAELVDASVISLNKLNSDSTKVPVKMVEQLKSVALNLKNLSQGIHDGPYGYDLDMVHQRLIHALKSGIAWARNAYQNRR
ncbi:hypothetical protein AAG747_12820 [Rapidithrix thailandica]|uniref:LysM domain-containing protein n=1 Tax=Rapidithrix thailandica TaxID=413964 RepID=A0AAW9SDN8_9BACT